MVNAGTRRRLEVHVQFEPNRIEREHLASAYEQLVPIVRRVLRSGAMQKTETKSVEVAEEAVGRVGGAEQ